MSEQDRDKFYIDPSLSGGDISGGLYFRIFDLAKFIREKVEPDKEFCGFHWCGDNNIEILWRPKNE